MNGRPALPRGPLELRQANPPSAVQAVQPGANVFRELSASTSNVPVRPTSFCDVRLRGFPPNPPATFDQNPSMERSVLAMLTPG
ncbi:MAG: hypothetical protein CM15mP79_0170 [Methanobacteriota archaeon]|nr:MAG: hypothetical protein CM15mP79_0170 [Euryarchaeota archaeon]